MTRLDFRLDDLGMTTSPSSPPLPFTKDSLVGARFTPVITGILIIVRRVESTLQVKPRRAFRLSRTSALSHMTRYQIESNKPRSYTAKVSKLPHGLLTNSFSYRKLDRIPMVRVITCISQAFTEH